MTLDKDLLQALHELKGEWIEYAKHPSDTLLRCYVSGALPRTLPRPQDVLPELLTADLPEHQWTHYLVGAHVRTCALCHQKVAQLRNSATRTQSKTE
jgi:hypothetical protein